MRWLNEPAVWRWEDGRLTVTAEPRTDFWRATHYGYIRGSGHLFGAETDGDTAVAATMTGHFAGQYDQGGLMAWVDERHWVKFGIEWFDGRLRLSTVVTIDHSSWSMTTLPEGAPAERLRMARTGDAVQTWYGAEPVGLAYLPPQRTALVGLMCAAPESDGFGVEFRDVSLPTD